MAGIPVISRSYADAMRNFSWELLWSLVSGNEKHINIAHECVDRHPRHWTAVRIQFQDGRTESCDFGYLADLSSRWAHFLASQGAQRADRVAIVMEPSIHFYATLFGVLKLGAVAVPLYPLFGVEGLALRLEYLKPKLVIADKHQGGLAGVPPHVELRVDGGLEAELARLPATIETADTAATDDALIQFTSGTTRMMPQPIHQKHRTVVTSLHPAIYGYGIAAEDRYLCVSPPSWGHGLSFGTIAPLALGTAVGTISGKFDPRRVLQALEEFRITNLSAVPTVYRSLRNSDHVEQFKICLNKVSYTGEAMDEDTFHFIERTFGTPPCGVYGTAEASSFLGNFCGFSGYTVKPGSLGKPMPGKEVAVFLDSGGRATPNEVGEIRLLQRGEWYKSKDLGYVDEDGYFFHAGRNDDVIISSGWTISPLEIENILLQHPSVLEAAVVASPDPLRGFVPKAFIVAKPSKPVLLAEIQSFVKDRLSMNQYPRKIELVSEIPKTSAGKIDRRRLRVAESETISRQP